MTSKRAELNIIVATDKKHGYGKNGEIPWKLEHEFGYFLKMIENKAIILGKNCWVNDLKCKPFDTTFTAIVSTSLPEENNDKYSVSKSMDAAITSCQEKGFDHIFIGGGKSIYEASLHDSRLKKVFITEVDGDFECDAIFPWEVLVGAGFSKITEVKNANNQIFSEFSGKNPHEDPNCGVKYSFTCYMKRVKVDL